MDHKVKNMETIKLPRLRIIIRGWGCLAAAMLPVHGSWTLFLTFIGICLGYRILRLTIRLFGLLVSVILTLVSILTLFLIILLVII